MSEPLNENPIIPPENGAIAAAEVADGDEAITISPQDRQLAASCHRKLAAGESPLTIEALAATRVNKADKDAELLRLLRRVPKKIYCLMAGKPQQTTDSQGRLHNIPTDGAGGYVNLADVVRAFHAFLTTHASTLSTAKREGGGAGRRLLELKIREKELELAEQEGRLVNFERIQQRTMFAAAEIGRGMEADRQRLGPLTGTDAAMALVHGQLRKDFKQNIDVLVDAHVAVPAVFKMATLAESISAMARRIEELEAGSAGVR